MATIVPKVGLVYVAIGYYNEHTTMVGDQSVKIDFLPYQLQFRCRNVLND